MHQRRADLRQPVDLARLEVDGVAIEAVRAQEPVRLVGVEIVAGLRVERPTQAISSVCSEIWVCIRQSGCSAQRAPSASSCASVEVGEKRGVMT
jgi:hypothetical protein